MRERSSGKAKPLPYLDTIETAQISREGKKGCKINGFDGQADDKLYINQGFDMAASLVAAALYYKRRSLQIAEALEAYAPLMNERAQLLTGCGTVLHIAGDQLIFANFCRQRICPQCQRRKALKTGADIHRLQEYLGTEYRWLHVVLTVPNVARDQLTSCIDKLYRDSSALFKDKRIKQGFKGVLRCLEVAYNADTALWHPHLHCLVAVKKSYFTSRYYIPQNLLMWKWVYYTGIFRKLQVSMQKITDEGGVAEVAKYCVKPFESEITGKPLAELTEQMFGALHGRRLVQAYGVIRDAARACRVDLNGDELTGEGVDADVVDRYVFDFDSCSYVKL